eukprot:Blabericola_migrator_1__4194@NODE_2286_length_2996_cov_997_503926_g1436_i0_p1_GENE_NODE_2286_length_2996_cov_997_503926_g1436_i0NODE_2286_length_2996_cov_997_503926_g1436_i0_p1_ORF_typecomplete_len420_score85_26DUF4432/PF14486_6/7e58Aldose_epim/PF01263_20/4_1e03Aldose_epim/PF01263_20/0_0025GPIanchored/PF10342_9/1_8e02GPIanchored/PF10342_9/49GPIanchored/PF10342_9/2_2e02_NODE_2286_length_2996_cov_997_503926_g1436_i04621721
MRFASIFALVGVASTAPVTLYGANVLNTNAVDVNGHTIQLSQLHGGKQEGTIVLDVTVKDKYRVRLVPSRGLNVYKVYDSSNAELGGWNNGVNEIVNPIYVNQMDRAGSGFLDGFNEMIVRCGYEYVGHAGEDGDNGLLTLHGKAANIPVSTVEYDADAEPNAILITGTLYERAFKKAYFTLQTSIAISLTAIELTIKDTLKNEGAYAAEYMSLYHSNFGAPILAEGATLHIPARQVSPFNAAAGGDLLATWDQLQGPTDYYDETVYNIFPYGGADNITTVAMINDAVQKGIQISFDIGVLPALSLWKNLENEKLGYAVGLEPGTSFSYNRAFQRDLGLVPTLNAGASVEQVIKYTFLTTEAEVTAAKNAVEALKGDVEILPTPLSDEGASDANASGAPVNVIVPTLAVVILFLISEAL